MTPEDILRAAARHLLDDEDAPFYQVVTAARRREPRTAYVILSAAESAGMELSGPLRSELAAVRARSERYVRLLADLRRRHLPVRALKGPVLAACYPRGVVRGGIDLDLSTRGERPEDLLRHLGLTGWRPRAATRLREPSGAVLMMHLRAPDPGDGSEPDAVEVGTVDWFGNGGTVPPVADLGPDDLAVSVVALAGERFERSFGFKDACDLHFAARHDPGVVARSAVLARRAGCPREFEDLVVHTHRVLGLPGDPPGPVGGRWPAVRHRMQRCETVLRRPALLLRAAQLEAVTGRSGAAHTACHALLRLYGNRRTPDMIEFGLPVARRVSADQVRPDDAVFHTPVGDFLMTTSSAVDGDELVRLGLEPA